METCIQVIVAAVLLHNFCKDYDATQVIPKPTECIREGLQRLDVWLMRCQNNVDLHATLDSRFMGDTQGGFKRALQRSRCRRRLVLTINRQGISKPPWATIEEFVLIDDDDDDFEDIVGVLDEE